MTHRSRLSRRVAVLLLISSTLGVGLVDPASAEPPSDRRGAKSSQAPSSSEPAGVVDAESQSVFWFHCGRAGARTLILGSELFCPLVGSEGYVHLGATGGGARRLEICNFSNITIHGIVDPLGPAAPIWYSDPPGGGCYIRDLGYPIRKFRGERNGYSSGWALP